MVKVYLFYLHSDTELYAYTERKDLKKQFLNQRNRNCFKVSKIKLEENEFESFKSEFRYKNIREIPLNDTLTSDLYILGTTEEESKLLIKASELDDKMYNLFMDLSDDNNFKDKYVEAIEYLCNIFYFKYPEDKKPEIYSKINLFHLFMSLFRNTFYEEDD